MTAIQPGLPALRFCREYAGLPPGPVKEDRKLFHIDINDERPIKQIAAKAQWLASKIRETGFAGGLITGLALTLGWVTINGSLQFAAWAW